MRTLVTAHLISTDFDAPRVVVKIRVRFDELLEQDRHLDTVGRAERVELNRVLSHLSTPRQIAVSSMPLVGRDPRLARAQCSGQLPR